MRKLYGVALAILFFVSACTKIESTTIGSGLIPPIDGVTTIDTLLDVFTSNFKDLSADSLKVYAADDHVIGFITDPVFGTTSATTYLELKPASYKFAFPGGNTVRADSAVLILSYKGFYGDQSIPQHWAVKEVTDLIHGDTAYGVNQFFGTSNFLASSATINIPALTDSIHYGFEDAANQIRIKLDDAFAKRIIENYDSGVGHPYESDSLFRESFKGFAVMPVAGNSGNALIRINLSDTNTKLALFYRYQASDSKIDTTVSYFRFSDGTTTQPSGHGNYIKREYAGYPVNAAWNDVSGNSEHSYIQTAPGTFSTIKIPGLSLFPNAIIHRAELLVFQDTTVANTLQNILTPPRYLLLSSYDSVAKVKTNIHNDYVVSSGVANPETFGGFLTQKDLPAYGIVNSYTFDITRYVQGIVTRKDTTKTLRLTAPVNDSLLYTDPYPATAVSGPFYIRPSIANNAADGRVVLAGGSSSKQQIRMRLRIIYSKI